jgi:hypothetical protein
MFLRSREYHRFAYDKLPHMIEYGLDVGTASMNAVRAYRRLNSLAGFRDAPGHATSVRA